MARRVLIGGSLPDRPTEHAILAIEMALTACYAREKELARIHPSGHGGEVRAEMRQYRRHTLRQIASAIEMWRQQDGTE